MDELTELRGRIDAIDRELLRLLGARRRVVHEVARVKAREAIPVEQPDRRAHIAKSRTDWARDEGLDPEFVAELFRLLVDQSCRDETSRMP